MEKIVKPNISSLTGKSSAWMIKMWEVAQVCFSGLHTHTCVHTQTGSPQTISRKVMYILASIHSYIYAANHSWKITLILAIHLDKPT